MNDPHDRDRAVPDWREKGVRVIKATVSIRTRHRRPACFGRRRSIMPASARRRSELALWRSSRMPRRGCTTMVRLRVIYVVRGRARMRWGERLEYVAEAGPGDFIYVPPHVPHQEINADPEQPLDCVLVRSDNEAVVVNIDDVDPIEPPEEVYWVDPIHSRP
jgi:hypothetical protein